MTLSTLIKKGGLYKLATAIPATAASKEACETLMVAGIATVAVANTSIAPMPPDEEKVILAWLVRIKETDEATIKSVLGQCRANSEIRNYYLRQAGEIP